MIWNHCIRCCCCSRTLSHVNAGVERISIFIRVVRAQASVCVFVVHFHLNESYSFSIHITRTYSLLKWIINRRCINLARRKVIMKFSLTSWKSCLTLKTSNTQPHAHRPPTSLPHTHMRRMHHCTSQEWRGARTRLFDIQCEIRCVIKWINAQGFRAYVLHGGRLLFFSFAMLKYLSKHVRAKRTYVHCTD